MSDLTFTAIDVETANPSRTSICQIGLAQVSEGRVGKPISILVNPEEPFGQVQTGIHGIDERAVRNAETLRDIHPRVCELIRGGILVSHSSFDRQALEQATGKYGLEMPQVRWLDSGRIARAAWPERYGRDSWSLKKIADDLGISFQHHEAGDDARVAALIVLRACSDTGLGLDEWLRQAGYGRHAAVQSSGETEVGTSEIVGIEELRKAWAPASKEEATTMPTPKLGKLEEVNSWDIWGYGFTSWLADNLDLLGNELGLKVTFIDKGFGVGSYRLNILAEESKGGKVAIEDRIGWTDYSHLGQSLKYAAECDAQYVVWVARHFDAEHRAAIDWLNRLASDKVWFYGVELRVVKIGNSLPAPDFHVVAAPEEWWRTIPDALVLPNRYQAFFQPLIDNLRKKGITEDTEGDILDSVRCFHSGFENVFYLVRLDEDSGEVACYFEGPEAITWAHALQKPSQGVEESLKEEWGWLHWNEETSIIQTFREGFIDAPEDILDEVRAWMLQNLSDLKKVLTPRLEKMQAEMEG